MGYDGDGYRVQPWCSCMVPKLVLCSEHSPADSNDHVIWHELETIAILPMKAEELKKQHIFSSTRKAINSYGKEKENIRAV
jgi:hypothetical protein